MKKRGLFAMKERDFQCNKIVKIAFLEIRQCYTVAWKSAFDIPYFIRKHRLILKFVLKLEKVPFSPRQHILNCLVTYSLKLDSNGQKFNECLTV